MSFKNDSIYFTDSQPPETYSLDNQIAEHLEFRLAKDKTTATSRDVYAALSLSVRDRMIRKWLRTQRQNEEKDVKTAHYLSLEFLMGRLLGNALTNLGFYEECDDMLEEIGFKLEDVIELERDMGLGNGGLGRLAACFLDSLATLELPAIGYGIRYEYGIFRQEIENGFQIEKPDHWLSYGNPWEVMKPEMTYRVKFFGRVETGVDRKGAQIFNWVDTEDVLAVAYDVPVPGYDVNTVNSLRLWQAKSTDEFNFTDFNQGYYFKAVEDKNKSEVISKVLYPNDNVESGKELRLKQQYFFVSATIQNIIEHFKKKHSDFKLFPEKNAIHLNDTHPAIAIPELMRILLDEERLGWEEAWEICSKTFAYTNHTVLSEALEKWDVDLFGRLLPRHLQIIFEINHRFLRSIRWKYGNDFEKMNAMSIIEESGSKKIRMANLSIIGSHSVNGVAALHTEIIKKDIFRHFAQDSPEKFNNKTNGITQRRWLKKANPFLSNLISDYIGDGWISDLNKIRDIEKYASDPEFIQKFRAAKQKNKQILIEHIEKEYGIQINPESMFDAQIKRIHEYKRQLLNAIRLIAQYNKIKGAPNADYVPRTVIFSGKAAPGYYSAKLIIKLINEIADVVNNDPDVGDQLKVVFLKNYSVTLAEMIIPAADLSEQISTAGFEASGTGNMKFQLNGALTIGTLDGANIEIMREVGKDNIFIFGLDAAEVVDIKNAGYNPWDNYNANPDLKRALDMINDNFFCPYDSGLFKPLFDALTHRGDPYCLLADFDAYVYAQEKADELFRAKSKWTQKAILNVARSGKFSSDRTIKQYADEIWKISPAPVDRKDLNYK